MALNQDHLDCVFRKRRLLNHNDPAFFLYRPELLSLDQYAEIVLAFTSHDEFRFDTVLWDVDGGMACYPSQFIPQYPALNDWLNKGNDFLPSVISLSKERGLETFLSFRVNAGQDPNFDAVSFRSDHKQWLLNFNEFTDQEPQLELPRLDGQISMQKLDYGNPDVRKFQLGALTELVQYEVDGLQLDFARGAPFLHVGHQWELREELTKFVRAVRKMMQQRASDRDRPLLLAVRIAESVEGCHFDGIDIETWVREELVDLLIVGARSFDVEIAAFKSMLGSAPVKVYPTHDNHHSSDGYKGTSLPVLRGLASNWWHQGADGIGVFNFRCSDEKLLDESGLRNKPVSPCHHQDWDDNRTFLSEADDFSKLAGKAKTYVIQRRSGGAPWEFGYPEDEITVIHAFQTSNALAPLPGRLGLNGEGVTFFTMYVGEQEGVLRKSSCRLRMLLSDAAEHFSTADLIEAGLIRRNPYVLGDGLYTTPLAKATTEKLEARWNNIRLQLMGIEEGWLVYVFDGSILANGKNLLTLKLEKKSDRVRVEKVELDINQSKHSAM